MTKLNVPPVLTKIGEDSRRNGMDKLTSRQTDSIIKQTRTRKTKQVIDRRG